MTLLKPHARILHFEFPNIKEMVLTFFRVEEHYESVYPNIREQRFTVKDFLDTFMEDDGEVVYFSSVYGFNVPSDSLKRFYQRHADILTPREQILLDQIKSAIDYDRDDFYVIASTQGDDRALDHELSHAFYYLDTEYHQNANELIDTVLRPDLIQEFRVSLEDMSYSPDVLYDEITAFLAAGKISELRREIEVSASRKDALPFRKLYQKSKIRILQGDNKHE